MSHDKLSDLCPIYVVGALDGEDQREFQSHLESGCPACQQQIHELTQLAALLPLGLSDASLSPDVKNRLMTLIEKQSAVSPRVDFKAPVRADSREKTGRGLAWLPWACATAAGIALVISLWNSSHLRQELSNQQARFSQQQQQVQQLQQQLEQEKSITAFLSHPEVRVMMLAGTPKSPQASGKILWSAVEKKALFYATNLPFPPAGKTYQLWVITDKPFDAGTFSVDQAGSAFLRIDSLTEADKAQKFAVTLEPAGGVPQPTGEMHLLGSL